ncbi:MAG: GH3 auxin-responsive promoter [Cytophagaceae bacterium SCN 52-12]|nr:MAG: GH3 auxin-responsive promoter [Cytophagaceae bacterium SCN 52-12]
MALLGNLIKTGVKLGNMVVFRSRIDSEPLQRKSLAKLLAKARDTAFGQQYNFEDILAKALYRRDLSYYEAYKKLPVFDYTAMHRDWWHRVIEGEKDICWPGRVKYFALSSGTSEAASKQIPVTKAMSKAIQRTSIRQILALGQYRDLPDDLYEKGFLMLSGSTNLSRIDHRFEGDLSGISIGQIPFWFKPYYKPGEDIARTKDWETKLNEITKAAHKWDIGYIVGVPAWLQLLLERIISHYKVDNIHDIWPNLNVFAHGGVSFEPYRMGFQKLLGRPIHYIETYLASEGFLAYQTHPEARGMQLVLDNGIFFEFIPFNEKNFDPEGNVMPDPETFLLHEAEEGREYAVLISTCSGAWRYLIGDTVKIVNKPGAEIIITGRTKHFLSLCGEHLSVDNMNKAVDLVSEKLGISIPEFTVIGKRNEKGFSHHWYVATDSPADPETLKGLLDEYLKKLNDDYVVERKHALNEITVTPLPVKAFYGWMESRGKMGGQNKFARVLKNKQVEEWEEYLRAHNFPVA